MHEKTRQRYHNLRVCASCESVYWGKNKACPICGFAHYGAIWALGFWNAMFGWITKSHKFVKPEHRI